jgi:hypothetical protein
VLLKDAMNEFSEVNQRFYREETIIMDINLLLNGITMLNMKPVSIEVEA